MAGSPLQQRPQFPPPPKTHTLSFPGSGTPNFPSRPPNPFTGSSFGGGVWPSGQRPTNPKTLTDVPGIFPYRPAGAAAGRFPSPPPSPSGGPTMRPGAAAGRSSSPRPFLSGVATGTPLDLLPSPPPRNLSPTVSSTYSTGSGIPPNNVSRPPTPSGPRISAVPSPTRLPPSAALSATTHRGRPQLPIRAILDTLDSNFVSSFELPSERTVSAPPTGHGGRKDRFGDSPTVEYLWPF